MLFTTCIFDSTIGNYEVRKQRRIMDVLADIKEHISNLAREGYVEHHKIQHERRMGIDYILGDGKGNIKVVSYYTE